MLHMFGSSCKGVLPTTHHTIACRRCRLTRPRPTASTTASKVASYGSSPRVRGEGRGWATRERHRTYARHRTRPRTHHTPTYKSADSEFRAVRMRHAHALHRCRTGCGTTYPRATPRGSRKVKRRRHVHAQRATQGGSSRRSRPISPFVCPPAAACRHVGWQRRLPELPCSRQSWAWRSGSLADRNGRH